MARPNKRNSQTGRSLRREEAQGQGVHREHRWESPEVGEDVTAIELAQQSAGTVSDRPEESEDEDVLVSEGEGLEKVDESGSMASTVELSSCSVQQCRL